MKSNLTFLRHTALLLLLLTLNIQVSTLFAQGTAFMYQGQLKEGANAAAGIYDLRFTIYDSTNNPGVLVAGPVTNAGVNISNGLFTVALDFGPGVFTGVDRWLEIAARTNGAAFATLNPRQKLTATPYAVTAGNLSGVVSNASLAGTYSSPVTLNNSANSFSGNGAGLTGLNASQLTIGAVPSAVLSNAWKIGGNAGTTAGTHFLGTTDNQPLEIKVNGLRALRVENPGDSTVDIDLVPDGAPNVIGGSPRNFVSAGVVGATIGGGGATNYSGTAYTNSVSADFGVVGGGGGNRISSPSATIAGGRSNTIHTNSDGSAIGGGELNVAASVYAAIAGGFANVVGTNAGYATIAGGYSNDVGTNSEYSAIGGGDRNKIGAASPYATIAGGRLSGIGTNSPQATIGGGLDNQITSDSQRATIAGGSENQIVNSIDGTIAGGADNHINSSLRGTIGGGGFNDIGTNSTYAVIGGGFDNDIAANSSLATIAGGGLNDIAANSANSTIGGGTENTIGPNASNSTIAGGESNGIGTNASFSGIGGGRFNTVLASATYATIPGGRSNVVASFAFAAGFNALAINQGAMVWSDSAGTPTGSTNNNSVTLRARGGYRFFSDGGTNGVYLAPGGGSWVNMSDRNAKENFAPIDIRGILDKVAALPLHAWNYKSQAHSIRHLGPMAQDFKAAFGLGETDTGIATVDADGVALAAIQGLNQKLEDRSQKAEDRSRMLEKKLQQKETEIAELKQRLDALESIIRELNSN